MTDATTIAPLTKVALTLSTEKANTPLLANKAGVDFTFVCGLGIEGLTDFEMALLGKSPGDHICLSIGTVPPAAQFEHLLVPFMDVVQTPSPFELHIVVKSVVPVTERELVHALSRKTEESGCNCDGGCGCGG